MAQGEGDGPRAEGSVVAERGLLGEGGISKALREGKGWTEDELLAYAKTIDDNHPIFAESVEEMDPVVVEAIQQIKMDGKDPYQLAEQAKNHGNRLFGWGKKNPAQYTNAITSYTEAEGWARQAPDDDQTRALLSTIYCNRAFAHLMIKNYKSCNDDCDRALRYTRTNVKAIYRKARACSALKHDAEAVRLCDEGLAVDPENKELQQLRVKSAQALEAHCEKERKREDAKRARVEAERARLRDAWDMCGARGVRLGAPHYAGGENAIQAEALPAVEAETGQGVWPVLLLYPQYQVFDFVERAPEGEMVGLVLAEVMPEEGPPAPWDQCNEYRCSEVEVYFQASSSKPLDSFDAYVSAVERFLSLLGRAYHEDVSKSSEKAEAELDSLDMWKDHGEYWVHVHPGCTLLEVLQHKHHVVPATISALHIFARRSRAHLDFRARNHGKIKELHPESALGV